MEEIRDRIIAVRVTEQEHAIIAHAAIKDRRPVASFARLAVLAQAESFLKEKGSPA